MSEMNPWVREWMDKSRKDWVSLEILMVTDNPDTAEAVCFLAQQSAEKLMKGLLVQKKIAPPKTHSLIELQFLLESHYPLSLNVDWLDELSVWAVESRYPGVTPTWEQASSAVKSCQSLRLALLPLFENNPK